MNKNITYIFIIFLAYTLMAIFTILRWETGQIFLSSLLVLLVPGAGISLVLFEKYKDFLFCVLLNILISSLISIFGLFIFDFFQATITPFNFLMYLFFASITPFFFIKTPSYTFKPKSQFFIFLVAFLFFGLMASHMELVEDQDIHFIAPNYGLVHELKPYKHISRAPFLLEHPTWPHFLSAMTNLIAGDIDSVKDFYLKGKEIEKKYSKNQIWKHWDEFPDDVETEEVTYYGADKKLLFAVRIPHVLLSTLILLIIFQIIKNLTGSTAYAFLGLILYLNPEVIVRSSYAGYETPTLFIFLTLVYSFFFHKNLRTIFFLSFVSAWIAQKSIIIPIIFITYSLFVAKNQIKLSLYCLIGFITGLISYSLYGFWLNPQSLIHAFYKDHGVIGLFMNKDLWSYLASWTREFIYIGIEKIVLIIWAIYWLLTKNTNKKYNLFLIWMVVGFFIFLRCRWPNVYNCYLSYPPIILLLIVFLCGQKPRLRFTLTLFLILMHILHFSLFYKTIFDPNKYYMENECGKTPRKVLSEFSIFE